LVLREDGSADYDIVDFTVTNRLGPGESERVEFTGDTSKLSPGTYEGGIRLNTREDIVTGTLEVLVEEIDAGLRSITVLDPDPPTAGKEYTFTLDREEDAPNDFDKAIWDYGDGTTETFEDGVGVLTSHTYDEGGEFEVTATLLFDDGSKQDSVSETVVVLSEEYGGAVQRKLDTAERIDSTTLTIGEKSTVERRLKDIENEAIEGDSSVDGAPGLVEADKIAESVVLQHNTALTGNDYFGATPVILRNPDGSFRNSFSRFNLIADTVRPALRWSTELLIVVATLGAKVVEKKIRKVSDKADRIIDELKKNAVRIRDAVRNVLDTFMDIISAGRALGLIEDEVKSVTRFIEDSGEINMDAVVDSIVDRVTPRVADIVREEHEEPKMEEVLDDIDSTVENILDLERIEDYSESNLDNAKLDPRVGGSVDIGFYYAASRDFSERAAEKYETKGILSELEDLAESPDKEDIVDVLQAVAREALVVTDFVLDRVKETFQATSGLAGIQSGRIAMRAVALGAIYRTSPEDVQTRLDSVKVPGELTFPSLDTLGGDAT